MGNCSSDNAPTVELISTTTNNNNGNNQKMKSNNKEEVREQNTRDDIKLQKQQQQQKQNMKESNSLNDENMHKKNELFYDTTTSATTNEALMTTTTTTVLGPTSSMLKCPFSIPASNSNGSLAGLLVTSTSIPDLVYHDDDLLFGGDDDNDFLLNNKQDPDGLHVAKGETKVKINDLFEAVNLILFPSSEFMYQAYKHILTEFNMKGDENMEINEADEEVSIEKIKTEITKKYQYYISHQMKQNGPKKHSYQDFIKKLGEVYFATVFKKHKKSFMAIGGTFEDFYNNISGLLSTNKDNLKLIHNQYMPSLRCLRNGNENSIYIYLLHENNDEFIQNFYHGLIKKSSQFIWDLDVDVMLIDGKNILSKHIDDSKIRRHTICFKAKQQQQQPLEVNSKDTRTNSNGSVFTMDANIFKSIFPYTIVFNRQLDIQEIGDGFAKYLDLIKDKNNMNLLKLVNFIEPKLETKITFEFLLHNQNIRYKIQLKQQQQQQQQQKNENGNLTINGSLIYYNDFDYLIFIGSPAIASLEELNDRGMYLSDIPLYDATRDLILISEQTKAQDGLKLRMQKLKQSITNAHKAIDEERKKNIELLNLIFPSQIARQLWMGERIPSKRIIDVTLLYSDIVGFTSICSTAQPIEIIEMLKQLYTDFDQFCGNLEIYKIETIGDAYVCAAGLHRQCNDHAWRVAWMGLLMIDSATKKCTHRGDKIKMRIGIHSGEVLAGIVGIKMPRYCLFGNNCTIANKYESLSEENRVHISPVTKKHLENSIGFSFEPRSSNTIPEGSQSKPGEISWFLNSYKHPALDSKDSLEVHVERALKELEINI